ncbi:hypothetical protein EVAR_44757_1 [Eumeta japonica]|uniref:Uncharacterized protein n=1 Tax=Eumeta variegata TaxID=151549 RepID=A0A4C1XJR3_EUMVA|nr:hypothetical protein EVAR_44757_1 [Eumeta japonica]
MGGIRRLPRTARASAAGLGLSGPWGGERGQSSPVPLARSLSRSRNVIKERKIVGAPVVDCYARDRDCSYLQFNGPPQTRYTLSSGLNKPTELQKERNKKLPWKIYEFKSPTEFINERHSIVRLQRARQIARRHMTKPLNPCACTKTVPAASDGGVEYRLKNRPPKEEKIKRPYVVRSKRVEISIRKRRATTDGFCSSAGLRFMSRPELIPALCRHR